GPAARGAGVGRRPDGVNGRARRPGLSAAPSVSSGIIRPGPMNIESVRDYCLARKGVTEGFPFGETVLVFKVMGRMFALLGLDNVPASVNLKCDPERAVELRERYADVQPGYH